MFFGKKYVDYVDLSVGKVYFKPIVNKIMQKVETLASKNGELNTPIYLIAMEKATIVLSKRKFNNLLPSDSFKVREKVKQILIREGLFDEVTQVKNDEADIFHKEDIAWFEKSKIDALNKVGIKHD